MKTLYLLIALMGLTACGPLAQNQPLVSAAQGIASAGSGLWTEENDPREALTRARIDAAPNDLLLFAPVSEEDASVFARVSANGDRITWASDDGDGLTLRNGVVIATRGLGNDLMGADVAQVYPAIIARRGSVRRIHEYLGGEDQIVRSVFQCEVVTLRAEVIEIFQRRHATRVVREACTGSSGSFTNLYWIDAAGAIWQSRQWVSARVGSVDIQKL
ncbi:YjbF family lipoprotein [Yoonia algicola]|uniref:YjbF family lipoprotein n=1 Tax=Yoonia algicola TaxID=3137368 RepID=A0AAN0NGL0_9RHOB